MAITPRDSTSGAKAQNAEWFASDVTPQNDSAYTAMFFVSFSIDAAVGVEYTLDSGSSWVTLHDEQGGTTFAADEGYSGLPILLRSGDTFNMRSPTAGGGTLAYCRIDEVY
jgi:hypothetical protein